MRGRWLFSMALVALACGGKIENYDDAMDAQLDLQEDVLDVLEGVDDQASAKAAVEKLRKLEARSKEIREQMMELPQPKATDMTAAMEKYADRIEKLQKRQEALFERMSKYPEVAKAMDEALGAMK